MSLANHNALNYGPSPLLINIYFPAPIHQEFLFLSKPSTLLLVFKAWLYCNIYLITWTENYTDVIDYRGTLYQRSRVSLGPALIQGIPPPHRRCCERQRGRAQNRGPCWLSALIPTSWPKWSFKPPLFSTICASARKTQINPRDQTVV